MCLRFVHCALFFLPLSGVKQMKTENRSKCDFPAIAPKVCLACAEINRQVDASEAFATHTMKPDEPKCENR